MKGTSVVVKFGWEDHLSYALLLLVPSRYDEYPGVQMYSPSYLGSVV